MSPVFHASARYWITGLLLAALGVALNRLASPAVEGAPRSVLALGGQLLGVGGLIVIASGIRRRIERASSENEAMRHGPR